MLLQTAILSLILLIGSIAAVCYSFNMLLDLAMTTTKSILANALITVQQNPLTMIGLVTFVIIATITLVCSRVRKAQTPSIDALLPKYEEVIKGFTDQYSE